MVDSRSVRDGRAVRRRRECLPAANASPPTRPGDPAGPGGQARAASGWPTTGSKVIVGVTKACEKRPVSLEEIEMIVDHVEEKLGASGRREVPSETIGLRVLEELRDVDEVAYVRFASVYRSFQDVDEFFDLLQDLRARERSRDRTDQHEGDQPDQEPTGPRDQQGYEHLPPHPDHPGVQAAGSREEPGRGRPRTATTSPWVAGPPGRAAGGADPQPHRRVVLAAILCWFWSADLLDLLILPIQETASTSPRPTRPS